MYVHTYSQAGGGGGEHWFSMLWAPGNSQRNRGVLRGACAEGLLGAAGLSRTQRGSGEKFIFIYLKIRCIGAGFDPADSLPYSLLKLLNWYKRS